MMTRTLRDRHATLRGDSHESAMPPSAPVVLGLLLCACLPSIVRAQTPSPLQEWQYSSHMTLQKLFEPNLPEWQVVLGVGAQHKPLYDGAALTRTQAGPVINIEYKDIAFASVGEGLGVNVLRGSHYRAGFALCYDLGRLQSNDVEHLRGMGNIDRSVGVKAFGSYAISKSFPLVLRADIRQYVGGADGMLADLDVYMPLPGSSSRLFMFAGPSFTVGDHLYMQRQFGVTPGQSVYSGYPAFDAHAGSDAVGFGFSATGFLTDHWLIDADAAANRLLGSARESPITQRRVQHAIALTIAYSW
ncbi:MAG TPA: MipA/OmpV family protein [Steroidobacteraceae bacterium]|nr:MipA/OmpV family protein [Steroidobacteraceae bacterium]